jgi:hypothetical protein
MPLRARANCGRWPGVGNWVGVRDLLLHAVICEPVQYSTQHFDTPS